MASEMLECMCVAFLGETPFWLDLKDNHEESRHVRGSNLKEDEPPGCFMRVACFAGGFPRCFVKKTK